MTSDDPEPLQWYEKLYKTYTYDPKSSEPKKSTRQGFKQAVDKPTTELIFWPETLPDTLSSIKHQRAHMNFIEPMVDTSSAGMVHRFGSDSGSGSSTFLAVCPAASLEL